MDATLEEAASRAPVTVRIFSPVARQLPDDVIASLEAVKAAQLAARERARRERWQAWAVVAGIATAATIGVLVVRPRIRAGRAATAATPAAAIAPAVTAAPPRPEAPSALEKATAGGTPSQIGLLAAGVAELPAPKAVAAASAVELDACRDSFGSKRWRTAADACAAAFTSHPDDAKLALRVAEAQYARDHLIEARAWAQRTLALDAKEADALAILAHSEQRSGDAEAAARAFRRYLALAPRGWHAAEARAALHGDRAPVSARPARPAATPTTPRPMDRSDDAPLPLNSEAATADAPSSAE